MTFSMIGAPRSKGRPRATVRGGFAKLYTDDKTRKYEASIKALAKRAMGDREPFAGPLSVSIRFRFEPAKSTSKRDRAALIAGEYAYIGSLDLDNMAKAALDGMNGACYLDDVQIVRLWVTKAAAEKSGVDVRVEPLGEPELAT